MSKFLVEVMTLQQVGSTYKWKRIGQVDSYISMDVIIRYNDVGSWTLVMAANNPQAALIQPGCCVVISYEGLFNPIMSGPVRTIKSSWASSTSSTVGSSASINSTEYPGTIEFSGPDHNTLMAEHLALPDEHATTAANGQFNSVNGPYTMAFANDTYAANDPSINGSTTQTVKLLPFSMERLLRQLVYYNFGDGSLAGRKVPGCTFTAPSTWPASTSYPKTTYDYRNISILEAVKDKAETCTMSDGSVRAIGYRWVWDQTSEQIGMAVFYPSNTTALGKSVRFSRDNGNLASYSYTLNAGKSNWMLFGLDGAGSTADGLKNQRFWIADMRQDPDSVIWNMSAESFKDNTSTSLYRLDSANNTPILDSHGNKQVDTTTINTMVAAEWLVEGPVGGLIIQPLDTPNCRFGVHYWLGDLVTVVENDVETTSVLREIHLSEDSNGPIIQSTIGDSTATETPGLYKEIRKIWRALRKTQQTKTGVIYG